MPEDVTARHRAGGIGRLLPLRTAAPRHAAAKPGTRALRPRRWPLGLGVLALVILAAVTPLALREPGTPQVAVPLPAISFPDLPAETDAPGSTAARRALRAVRQAAKASPSSAIPGTTPTSATPGAAPVLLGPASGADLVALLGSYCRSAFGPLTLAAPTADGWVCAPLGRTAVALDMNAMCRSNYGGNARAVLGSDTDPRSWRCYRDGP